MEVVHLLRGFRAKVIAIGFALILLLIVAVLLFIVANAILAIPPQ